MGVDFPGSVVEIARSLMNFLMTFSALENAIGRSAAGVNSVACFAALSAKSLTGTGECPGIH